MSNRLRVEHHTRYLYDTRVSTSQHLACLEPRGLPYQRVESFELLVDPAPARLLRRTDYFGNTLHQFEVLRPHDELSVVARSRIEVDGHRPTPPAGSLSWEDSREWLVQAPPDLGRDVGQYLGPSSRVEHTPEIAAFARDSFAPGRPLVDAAMDLMHRIHDDFVFDPAATTPTTPLSRVLADRRGVCQDFAHFQIACLRSLGLAARYVSGYLLTDPPPGQPRLIGADSSHAWLSIYVPGAGWIDLDPTNDVVVGERHVTISWGRDYGDITPLRGVLLGGARHQLFVGVSVVPIDSVENIENLEN